MQEKIQRFMQGRYGADELSKACLILTTVLCVISVFSGWDVFFWLGLALLLYTYWRMLSKNCSKRYSERQKFLDVRYRMAVKRREIKNRLYQRKVFHIYKCPQCRQKVRVPRGKGKICITCPKCKAEFIKKS